MNVKALFVALAFSLVALSSVAASDDTLRKANNAYNYDLHDEAIRLFTELLARQPAPASTEAADFHYKRAYSLFKLKRHNEAASDLLDALELGLDTAECYNLIALV